MAKTSKAASPKSLTEEEMTGPSLKPPQGFPVRPIKVGPFDFKVRWFDHAERDVRDAYGYCNKDIHTIGIFRHLNKFQMADVVIHEVMHATHFVMVGLDINLHSEEKIVQPYALGFTMVARDNPEFFKWWHSLLK